MNKQKAAYGICQKTWYRRREQVWQRDGRRCLRCGSTEQLSADHIIPRSLGGSSEVDNLQTLCIPCNNAKRLDAVDYRAGGFDLTQLAIRHTMEAR